MRDVFMIRHGESVANVERRCDSTAPGAPLTPRGHEQAQRAAGWLMAREITPAAVYASPFLRTQETAQPFLASVGASLRVHAELGEVDLGEWDGQRWDALRADPWYARWIGEPEIAPPGGESLAAVLERVLALIWEISAAGPGDAPLVLFTHQHPLRALLWRLGRLRDGDGRLVQLPNTAILHLAVEAPELRLVELDCSLTASAAEGGGRAAI